MTETALTDAEIAEIQRLVATTSARRHGWSNNTVMALLAALDAKEAELQTADGEAETFRRMVSNLACQVSDWRYAAQTAEAELQKALASQRTPNRDKIAEAVYSTFFGGTSDPTLDENAQGIAYSIADAVIETIHSTASAEEKP